jgi:hypothetical protein|tara:strand:+ start:192 stop:305 length:114 start_codon:yes stop_codon:yes gene_type:complete
MDRVEDWNLGFTAMAGKYAGASLKGGIIMVLKSITYF